MLDFKAANDKLRENVAGVCARYLPRGVRKGDWWLANVPWRVDRKPSLVVNLQSGRWQDKARPDERGDLIDLIARVTGTDPKDVVREVMGS